MKYVYLLKYKVNYTDEVKSKVFLTIEEAINFHTNYKHHILNKHRNSLEIEAFITHYEILVMELDFKQTK